MKCQTRLNPGSNRFVIVAELPEFLFLAIALAGLHIFPATSELHGGTRTPGSHYRVVILGDSRPRRFPLAYGDRIRFPVPYDVVLVYQRYQDPPLLEAVRLAGALQRRGCHFTTGTSVRLFRSLSGRSPYVNIKPNSDRPSVVSNTLSVEFLVLAPVFSSGLNFERF